MIRVIFICYGNICRSPMAKYMFKDMVEKRGIGDRFVIDSAATSREEIGNGVYPPAARKLASVGIRCKGHHARQFTKEDYINNDYVIAMEEYNVRTLRRMSGGDPEGKIYRLLDFTEKPRDIADPWYTGDFESTYSDIVYGCEGFLEYLKKKGRL